MIEWLNDATLAIYTSTLYLTPGLITLVFVMMMLAAAVLACRWSPLDPPAERHAVLVTAVIASGLALLVSSLGRAVATYSMWVEPPLFWRFYWAPMLAAGTLGFLALHSFGAVVLLVRALRGSRPSKDLRRVAVRTARQAGLMHMPRLVLCESCRSPFAATLVFRHAILLPADFENEPEAVQRGVLLHEMAHLRRGDCLTNLLCQFAGVLLWWNPLYWIAMRQITLQRELACDAAVLHEVPDESWYADLLVRMARSLPVLGSFAFAVAPMAAKSTLRVRLEAMVPIGRYCHPTDLEVDPMPRGMMLACVALIVTLVLTMEGSSQGWIEHVQRALGLID